MSLFGVSRKYLRVVSKVGLKPNYRLWLKVRLRANAAVLNAPPMVVKAPSTATRLGAIKAS
jgi:hypothetical protein